MIFQYKREEEDDTAPSEKVNSLEVLFIKGVNVSETKKLKHDYC
jgi:hypothetical protein